MSALQQLHASIASHFTFAERDMKTSELIEIVDDCAAVGLDLAELVGPLEVAQQQREAVEPSPKRQRSQNDLTSAEDGIPMIDISGLEPSAAQLVLTFAGRYCALLARTPLALRYFRAALAPEYGSPPAEAQLGLTQAMLATGDREQAAALTLAFWRAPLTSHDATPSRAHLHMAFLLAALSDTLAAPPHDALLLLRRLIPLFATAACSAVETLARRWLPSQVPASLRGGGEHNLLSEPFVQSALSSSRTFGSVALEPLVCAARRQLLFLLLRQTEQSATDQGGVMHQGGTLTAAGRPHVTPEGGAGAMGVEGPGGWSPPEINGGGMEICLGGGGGGGGISVQVGDDAGGLGDVGGVRRQRMEAAAVLACWCHFADFCIEETPSEAQAVAAACGTIEARLFVMSPTEWPPSHYTYLAAVAMYQDLSELRVVETWLREPELAAEVGKRLHEAGLPHVWSMLETHVTQPRARARRAERLAVLTPIVSEAVRQFYDLTVYPKWHVAEFFGVARAPSISERMRRQYSHFTWPCGEDATDHRILIAGAGSGHQVAQAMAAYEHVAITAVDLSAKTLAFAHMRLHQHYPSETARRVRFAVADLMTLNMASLPPAQLVCCIGVLHHVPAPSVPATLANLVAALVPGGVLQLGTYSSLGIQAWWEPTRRLVHKLAPSIVTAAGQVLRQPAPHELRELRAALIDLDRRTRAGGGAAQQPLANGSAPTEEELAACGHVCSSAEFYTSTGCRDLLLHPCECSFTLLELGQLLEGAGLDLVGMWFQSLDADRHARDAYRRAAAAEGYAPGDAPERQVDLRRWHALEQASPEIFGRMHVLYAQKRYQA